MPVLRTLSDTISRLSALRGQHGVEIANLGSADRLSTLADFGTNPGRLKARYYVPADLPAGAPLVVVLHGCTQSAGGYDHRSGWSHLADEAGFALLYPEQNHGNNPNLCFNWFRPEHTRRDAGEAHSIRQMIETMLVDHGLDRSRVFVTGLSAGGAMASTLLATYPDVFAGGAIVAGLAHGRASTVQEAFDRMRGHGTVSEQELSALLRDASDHDGPWPRVAIWHGLADSTVAPSNAEEIVAQWRSIHDLDAAPTATEATAGHARHVWTDAAGKVVVELNTVAAMGHGTPLDADLGAAGPYMLDVGISSTREIARFWGLAEANSRVTPARPMGEAAPVPARPDSGQPVRDAYGRGPQTIPDGHGIGKVIEDALRAAGLMR